MGENIILEKSYKFALRAVRLYKYLTEHPHSQSFIRLFVRLSPARKWRVENR
jgi:hypothetical protein